ncbi:MAG TPA: XrtA/PEP-CTERM system exopolysaccharide export protein [Stellaceae bacterium]|nr:XrtA/PEP-CTERM system exopolysaccharide export protein [Stellaceae bacterium]
MLPRPDLRFIAGLALLLLAGCSGGSAMRPSNFPPLAWMFSSSSSSHVSSEATAAELRPVANPAPTAAALTASEPVAMRPDADAAELETALPANPNGETYIIGPGDDLNIFVWRNPDLTTHIPVRPDGKISIPLVEDVTAIGKTPTTLAREIEEKLRAYVKDPIVTVIVSQFVGPFAQQVRVIGEASQPRAISYRRNMTVLDVVIEVGGLTRFAAGDRSVIVRTVDGKQETIKVHLADLVNDGDVADNVAMRPGDILIIPQRYF